jgi:glucose-1-phosphate thymidylyltransferase
MLAGMIERRQSYKIACIEEIAYNMGWIFAEQLRRHGAVYARSSYGEHPAAILDQAPAARTPGVGAI